MRRSICRPDEDYKRTTAKRPRSDPLGRVIEAINELQRESAAINFNTICAPARVSKTFLYDPKHSDLAEQIRSLRQTNPQSTTTVRTNSNKSDSAKDGQIARFKERIRALEVEVRLPQRRERTALWKVEYSQPLVEGKLQGSALGLCSIYASDSAARSTNLEFFRSLSRAFVWAWQAVSLGTNASTSEKSHELLCGGANVGNID